MNAAPAVTSLREEGAPLGERGAPLREAGTPLREESTLLREAGAPPGERANALGERGNAPGERGTPDRAADPAPRAGSGAPADARTLLQALAGEGKLRPVEAPTVLALIPGDLPAGSSRTRLAVLADGARWDVAVPFLAYALPAREAVWWACMCVRWAMPAVAAPEQQALAAAEAWVRRPDEAARQACLHAAKQAGRGLAASAVALGAHGARLGRPQSPLGNQWASTALRRVLLPRSPAERAALAARFVASGCDIAAGGAGRFPAAAVGEAAA